MSTLLGCQRAGPWHTALIEALNFSTGTMRGTASVCSLLKFNSRNSLLTATREIRELEADAAACTSSTHGACGAPASRLPQVLLAAIACLCEL